MADAMDIEGPEGLLETEINARQGAGPVAIACHPHPQYGGTMHDAVLTTLEHALLAHDVGCIRFNFRGVGRSAGKFADGVGERDDLRAVAEWTRANYPGAPLWLAGYSFGASVAWATMSMLQPARAVLIAPPRGHISSPVEPGTELDVVVGDADAFVDHEALDKIGGIRVHRLAGADHFFSGAWTQLEETLRGIVGAGLTKA